MNLLIFLDLTYNPCKNFKFDSLQGQNVQIFLIFIFKQGKIFLILPITRGGGAHVYLVSIESSPSPRKKPFIPCSHVSGYWLSDSIRRKVHRIGIAFTRIWKDFLPEKSKHKAYLHKVCPDRNCIRLPVNGAEGLHTNWMINVWGLRERARNHG